VRRSSTEVRGSGAMVRWSVRRILRAGCVLDVARSAIVLGGPRGFPRLQARSDSCTCIGMAAVRRFEDFDCWKLANELKLAIYELVERAHIKPDRDFCDQIRSAVASAPANIAEGFGRRSDAEFARFLDIARGSLNECRNHIGDARDRNYIDESERSALDVLASRAVGAVAGLQRHLRRGKRKRS